MSERLVKWIGADGGHKVGREVIVNDMPVCDICDLTKSILILVRHSHTGELEWVPESQLSTYPMRSEWGEK